MIDLPAAGGMAEEMTVTRANELLDQVVDHDQITQHRVEVAREFVADVAHYEAQMKASMKRLRAAVAASGTSLTGVGVSGEQAHQVIVADVARRHRE